MDHHVEQEIEAIDKEGLAQLFDSDITRFKKNFLVENYLTIVWVFKISLQYHLIL